MEMDMPTPPDQRVLKKKGEETAVVDLSKAKSRFLAIYSDPQDLRDEQDIAKDLGVHPAQLATWRNQPSFYEPGEQAFNRAFRGSLVTIKKALLDQALTHRSQSAIKTLLELAGQLEGPGTKVNIMNVQGGAHDDILSKLTDEELDDEIVLRLSRTSESDVVLADGHVVPASEIMEAEYVQLDCLDRRTSRRRVDTSGPQGKASPVSP